jgi:formate dehydrogenase subunit beta
MPFFATYPSEPAPASAILQPVLRGLLEHQVVQAILAPCITRDGRSVQLSLIRHADQIARTRPLLPVLPVSSARVAGMLCERVAAEASAPQGNPAKRVAVVMRPCEARATVELSKLRQVDLAQLLVVVVDCIGTVEEPSFRSSGCDPESVQDAMLSAAKAGASDSPFDLAFRHACTICVHPIAPWADLFIHLIGAGAADGLLLEARDASVFEAMGLTSGEDVPGRTDLVRQLVASRTEGRLADLDRILEGLAPRQDGTPGLAEAFEVCLRCGNCSTACPLCYCKECLFRTDALRQEPSRLLGLAERRGSARLPGDAMTFQLTRLNHVSSSCVGCGVCSSACPAHLPVDSLFQAVARATQALFDYQPGRSTEDPLPTTTFARDEFVSLGEA